MRQLRLRQARPIREDYILDYSGAAAIDDKARPIAGAPREPNLSGVRVISALAGG